jgi:hypothetical protein
VYRYQSDTFQADLHVDSDGIVIDYAGVWRRVHPVAQTDVRRTPVHP